MKIINMGVIKKCFRVEDFRMKFFIVTENFHG